jgi:apolipoprotein N-acyltransferase
MNVITRVVLAVIGGFSISLAFAPTSFGPAALIGAALVIAASWRTSLGRGALYGFLAGLAFFIPLMNWLTVVGTDAWLLLGAYCALWWALQGFGIALVSRLRGAVIWVPSIWVLQEALRDRIPFGGYPWGRLGFSQADSSLADYAAFIAVPGVTFVSALIATLAVIAVVAVRERALSHVLIPVGGIVALVGFSFVIPTPTAGEGPNPTAVIAVVQGGTPQTGMGAMDVRRAVLDNHVRETLTLANEIRAGAIRRPDVVVWPENSTDISPFADPTVAADISRAARAVDVPILVGAVTDVPGDETKVQNVGILWDPETGPGQIYVKNQPVPFGEFIPFRELLTQFIGRFDRIPRDFIAGDEPGVIAANGVVLGNVICFEVAYDQVVHSVVEGGAEVITVQTNNATYAQTSQPEQQLQIERIRSVETGRAVVVASTTGVSAFIAPDRNIIALMGEGQTGFMVEEVPLRNSLTVSTFVSPALEVVIVLIAVLAMLMAMVKARRLNL